LMSRIGRLLRWAEKVFPPELAYAHCDLPCGVYDPEQARIEAESVKACQEKFQASDDVTFCQRAVTIKEERAELVKHHLWVLWTDYFKPEHLQRVPQLHVIFWKATKAAGAAKKSDDPADGQRLLDAIAEVDAAFRATKTQGAAGMATPSAQW
jgi:nickel superoxide dismutase